MGIDLEKLKSKKVIGVDPYGQNMAYIGGKRYAKLDEARKSMEALLSVDGRDVNLSVTQFFRLLFDEHIEQMLMDAKSDPEAFLIRLNNYK